jgi:hypothetical protein
VKVSESHIKNICLSDFSKIYFLLKSTNANSPTYAVISLMETTLVEIAKMQGLGVLLSDWLASQNPMDLYELIN